MRRRATMVATATVLLSIGILFLFPEKLWLRPVILTLMVTAIGFVLHEALTAKRRNGARGDGS